MVGQLVKPLGGQRRPQGRMFLGLLDGGVLPDGGGELAERQRKVGMVAAKRPQGTNDAQKSALTVACGMSAVGRKRT